MLSWLLCQAQEATGFWLPAAGYGGVYIAADHALRNREPYVSTLFVMRCDGR